MDNLDQPKADVNINANVNETRKGVDTWRVVERIGIASVLLLALGTHFLQSDSSKQEYIQTQATEIATQAKLDHQEERINAQKTQEQLVEVITAQVTATTEQSAEARASRSVTEKVVTSLEKFNDNAEKLVERIDSLVEHVEHAKEAE